MEYSNPSYWVVAGFEIENGLLLCQHPYLARTVHQRPGSREAFVVRFHGS